MQHNYRSRYLLTFDNEHSRVNIHNYEKCNFEEAFPLSKPSKIFIGKRRICRMTEISVACEVLILMVIPF